MSKLSGINVKKLLTMKENIVGVYFTDNAIYCAILDEKYTNTEFVEYSIPKGLINFGEILDIKELSIELKKAISKLSTTPVFANISIQSSLVFSTIIHASLGVNNREKLEKAINLMLNIELPWRKEESYTDYLVFESGDKNNIGIFSVRKKIVDDYVSLFSATNIKVLSVEFDALSTIRIMKQNTSDMLSITASESNINIIVSNGEKIKYLFPVKIEEKYDKSSIEKDLKRIRNYYSLETGTTLDEKEKLLQIEEKYIERLGKNISNINYYPALGASERIAFLKEKDENISLFDTRPNNLYRHHRIVSSFKLIRQSTIAIALIIISAHVLFYSIISNVAERHSVFSSQPPKTYASVTAIKNETKHLNELTNTGLQITKQLQRFYPILNTIDNIFTEGIYPNSINISNIGQAINISGVAATRTQYNFFRNSISKMDNIRIVSFPLGDLNIQANIPFGITINVN